MLLLMAVPDLCRFLGRPALTNVVFVLFGMALGFYLEGAEITALKQAGEVGFILVLFEIGLEINLPRFAEFLPALRFAAVWVLVQYPLFLALARVAGFGLAEGLMASAALTGCSMSVSYPAWKHFGKLEGREKFFTLKVMIALELLAIVSMTVGSIALKDGISWLILVKLAGMGVTVVLISRFASHLTNQFQWIVEKTTHWRVHFLVLLVLVICALGERLGLSAPKTAFFLGLFMSRTEVEGRSIEEYISPISRRFLIPIFFVSLGMAVDVSLLFTHGAFMALCGTLLMFGFREVLHRRWLNTGGPNEVFLLFCPNLTMAALAATALLAAGRQEAATWVTLSGLFFSVFAIWLLPRAQTDKTAENQAAV
jgi:Kef-type K+ transport system membrane component KefB